MPLTINLFAGTGWPPSTAANDCVLAAFAEMGSWIIGTNNVDIKVNWQSIVGVAGSAAITATDTTYAATTALMLAQTDALPNNIKSVSNPLVGYGTLPGSNPSGAPTAYRNTTIWNAIVTNTNFTTGFASSRNEMTFNSDITIGGFDLDPTGLTCAGGKYGMYQATLHEVRELMGGFSRLTLNTAGCDLFSYSAANTRSFSLSGRYFSWDDGVTYLGGWPASGDLLDWSGTETGEGWQGTSTASPFQSTSPGSNPQLIRYIDGQLLSVMGLPMTAKGLQVCGFPTNTVAPVISGTPSVGQTLTRTLGTWVGQSSITTIGNWQRNGSNIGGATSSTYVLQSADSGTSVTWKDSASNTIGTNTQASNALSVSGDSSSGVGGKIQAGTMKFTSRPTDMPQV